MKNCFLWPGWEKKLPVGRSGFFSPNFFFFTRMYRGGGGGGSKKNIFVVEKSSSRPF